MNSYAILIPSYNSNYEKIKKTLTSLPWNSFIYIVDDGSIEPFAKVAADVIINFPNIKIIRYEQNKGIEFALNTGLKEIMNNGYEFFARMDIGDVSNESRFLEQVQFLKSNNDYGIVGSWANFKSVDEKLLFISKMPVENKQIRRKMYINNMFIHPSVMIRTAVIRDVGNYRYGFDACEDYDLFFRILKKYKGHNLPYAFIDYIVDGTSISSLKRKKQIINRIKIIYMNFEFFRFGVYPYYGLIRACVFLLISRKLTTKIRTIIRG